MHFPSAAESNVRQPRSTRANIIKSQRREKTEKENKNYYKALCIDKGGTINKPSLEPLDPMA